MPLINNDATVSSCVVAWKSSNIVSQMQEHSNKTINLTEALKLLPLNNPSFKLRLKRYVRASRTNKYTNMRNEMVRRSVAFYIAIAYALEYINRLDFELNYTTVELLKSKLKKNHPLKYSLFILFKRFNNYI